VHRSRSMK